MKTKEQRDMEKMIREFAVDAKRRAYLADRLKNERGLCLETTREIHAFLRDVEFTLRAICFFGGTCIQKNGNYVFNSQERKEQVPHG